MADLQTVRLVPSEQFTSYSPVFHEQNIIDESEIRFSVEASLPSITSRWASAECTLDVFGEEKLRVERFTELATRWNSETRHVSSLSEMEEHEALQEIIGMGQSVIPLIIHELTERPSWLLLALDFLVDSPPDIGEGSHGRLLDLTQAWIKWGRKSGYPTFTASFGGFELAA